MHMLDISLSCFVSEPLWRNSTQETAVILDNDTQAISTIKNLKQFRVVSRDSPLTSHDF